MYEKKIILTLEEDETINDAIEYAKDETNWNTTVFLIITNRNLFLQVYDDNASETEDYTVNGITYKNVIELNKLEDFDLKGFSGTATIDNGTGTIEITNPNTDRFTDYEVLTTVEDSLRAEVRVDKYEDKFIIRLFDSEGFVEYNQTLDCSETPVDVHYVVVYKKDN